MFKKVLLSYVIAIALFVNVFVVSVHAEVDTSGYDSLAVTKILQQTNVHQLKAKASLLMEASTGRILLENNINEKLPLASVTKIMSMLLVMEAIDSGKLKMEDMVVASDYATGMGGSQAYIEPGEQFTVKDALKAVAIHSSNDVTVALAEKISGSEDVFVALMNEKARKLGMKNTNFVDCTGLAELENSDHYSTAYDVALMSRELITKHKAILEFTGTFTDKFRNGEFDLTNTNKLVRFYEGCDGLKTGYTSKAGFCLSATASRNNMRLISVILGDTDSNTRFAETRKLLDFGFANFEAVEVNKAGDIVSGKEAEVQKGVRTKVKVAFEDDVKLLLGRGEKEKVTSEIRLLTNLKAPVKKGQKAGTAVYFVDGKEVGQANLVAVEKVEKASFIRLFFRMVGNWFGLGK